MLILALAGLFFGAIVITSNASTEEFSYNQQSKNIIIATSIGGSSHAHWVLEIGKILADRGHNLTYVTRDDQLHLVNAFPEIKAVSVGGPIYTTNIVAKVRNLNFYQIAKVVRKFLNDAYATDMAFYQHDPLALAADFLICDAFNDPCIDTAVALKKPFAITCTGILHQDISVPYMNSLGTTHHATSEHMTLWERFHHKYVDLIKILFHLYPELKKLDQHRQQFGLEALGLNRFKQWDNALKLINSYFGITPSQVLGPLTHMVGPVMSSQHTPLSDQERVFLDTHQRVAYVAFGQVVVPHQHKIELILGALLDQIERNQLDGVIWVGFEQQVAVFEQENPFMVWTLNTSSSTHTFKAPIFGSILSKDLFTPSWAAQFAILQHPSTVLFVSHGGASSANEATFHGVPILVLPYNGDQSLMGHALSVAGVARMYDHAESNFELIKSQIDELLFDMDGYVARNLTRMKTLAQIGSKRKAYAADLIEEQMLVASNGIAQHRYEPSRNMSRIKAMDLDLHFAVLAFIVLNGFTFHYMINSFLLK